MFFIGLTGGIASGKSLVADLFRAKAITVIDADLVARQVVMPGSPALQAIEKHFGHKVISPSGTLDRTQLRDIIFQDPKERRWLENRLHPEIRQTMLTQAKESTSPYTLLMVPLLIETLPYPELKRILVVDCPIELQQERLREQRKLEPSQINAILSAQATREARLAKADDVIHNASDIENLRTQVDALHQAYMEMGQTNVRY